MNATENYKEGSFQNKDDFTIFTREWSPLNTDVKGIVYMCHGIAEYSGRPRYHKLASMFNNSGFLVVSQDYVGHGKSGGPKVMAKSCDDYVADVEQHLSQTREKYPDLPVFAFGFSMGGWVAIKLALNNPAWFKGLIAVGAMVTPNPEVVTPLKVAVSKRLAKIWPSCPIGKLDISTLSRNKEEVQGILNDPLCYNGWIRVRMGMATISAMAEVSKRLSELKMPILIQHGDTDKICELEGSKMLDSSVSSKDKTFTVYPGCYHDIFNEPEGHGERCCAEIADWVSQRV